ncbi:hypothetical protein H310_07611 [Aphanomyces invadans]|uniref:UDENN domain-containing protein n=1 Tax=Aphanomyces invadans TaxID=157072 RepID=A0A024U3L8_9STRA|nr:hypothetical protein H310_07611 [Aphanomyces invadans]ETW00218.1 hypothetical protein H310_07611 [Aphanomyces invadans]|eukprot:XP_008871243.1 hypothetical protein H310_07611 [Aphanomyces invadans]
MSVGKDFIVAVVCFDHRIGPEIEFVYPPPEEHHDDSSWQDMKIILPHLALPSRHEAAAEKSTSTSFFFHVPPPKGHNEIAWKGVAYYDVIHPQATQALDVDTLAKYSRGAIQKSVVVLSKTPYQAYVMVKLDSMARQFFSQVSFGDFGLVVELHDALCSVDMESLSWPQLHIGLPLQTLVRAMDVHLIGLLRLLLVEGRIVMYSQSPQVVSSSVLAFVSLLPGGIQPTYAIPHAHRYRWAKYGFPLALVHPTFAVEPYLVSPCAASMLQQPANQGGFLVGSCDPICLKFHSTLDAVVDLDAQSVHFHSARAAAAATLGPSSVDCLNNILSHATDALEEESGVGTIDWIGSDDWIRQQVQLYMEKFVTDVATEGNVPRRRSSLWALMSSPAESRLSMEYNDTWLQLWYGTVNYSQWLKSHRLYNDTQRQSPPVPVAGHVAYTYPNGDTYDGEFRNQMRHGRGKYVVANTSHTYEGQWEADQRHGHGTLKSMHGTYDGTWSQNEKCGYGEFSNAVVTYKGMWRHNVYHGSGVLVQPGLDYDGEFVRGQFDGMGKCTFKKHAEWTRYRGEWRRGVFHGCGTLEYGNGDVYVGEFDNGKRSGQGTVTSNAGDVYTGEWKSDMQDGHGSNYSHISKETKEGRWVRNRVVEGKHEQWIILYPNKDKYIGMCQGGRPWGQGICRYANGSVYTGEWIDGLREGLGIFCDPNGRTFEGEWRNSQPWKEQSVTPYVDVSLADNTSVVVDNEPVDHEATSPPGDGVYMFVYANGDTYHGRFRHGQRHGTGIYTSKLTRHVYDGEWDMDQRHGKGILTSGTNDFIYDGDWRRDTRTGKGTCVIRGAETYTGDWNENRFDGTGVYTDADGSVYEGEFRRGLKHGMGKLTNPSDVYQGEFQNGERSGVGTCTYASGDVYTGDWKANQRHGDGIMLYKSGERYAGQWRNNVREGCGCLTDARGTTKDGVWSGDAPMNGDWHITFATGSAYNGQCVQGKPHGTGVCKYTNGDVYSGEWVHGARSGWGVCVFANGDVFEGEWTSNHVSLNGKGTLTMANGTVHAYAQ